MYEYKKLPYGAKQMMLMRYNPVGDEGLYTPFLPLKGHWLLDWGFDAGDQVTLIGLADGVIVMQVTKTREEFEREGWPKKKHHGLTYEQLFTIANNLLINTQVFCQKIMDYTRAA